MKHSKKIGVFSMAAVLSLSLDFPAAAVEHKVQKGDSLWKIAQENLVSDQAASGEISTLVAVGIDSSHPSEGSHEHSSGHAGVRAEGSGTGAIQQFTADSKEDIVLCLVIANVGEGWCLASQPTLKIPSWVIWRITAFQSAW